MGEIMVVAKLEAADYNDFSTKAQSIKDHVLGLDPNAEVDVRFREITTPPPPPQ